MSDFSTFAIFTAGLAAFAPLVSALDVKGGSDPSGPAVYQPGYGSIVPAGKQFAITWDTTDDKCGPTVDLVLLSGPSPSQMQAQSYIVKAADNNGTYLWTPSSHLKDSGGDTGYGIELLCSKSDAYQYTTQFGISNDNYSPAPSSSSSSASASTTAPASKKPVAYTTEVVTDYTTYCPYATSFAVNNKTYTVTEPTTLTINNCPCTVTKPVSAYGTGAPYPAGNSTAGAASGTISKPASLTTATSSAAATSSPATTSSSASSSVAAAASPSSTGAAAQLGASLGGLVIAAGVAVFAL